MLMRLLGGGRHDFFFNCQWKAGRHSASAPPSPGPDHTGVRAQRLVRGQAQEDNGPSDVLFGGRGEAREQHHSEIRMNPNNCSMPSRRKKRK